MPPVFEYTPDVVPNVPIPFFTGWGFFADLFGQQAFRGPIRAYAGTAQAPSYTFDGQNRTGWYSPWENAVGFAIAGFLRFYADEEGTGYLNTLGRAGVIKADNLTTNQSYQLPDASGVIALVGDLGGGTGFVSADYLDSAEEPILDSDDVPFDVTGKHGRVYFEDSLGGFCQIRVDNDQILMLDGSLDYVFDPPAAEQVSIGVDGTSILITVGSSAARTIGWRYDGI